MRLLPSLAAILATAALAGGCDRVDEPPPNRHAASPSFLPIAPRASAHESAPVGDAGRCIVPLGPPPPPARKAMACPSDPSASPPVLGTGRVVFREAPEAPALDVEVAKTPREHERGLMYRTSLAESRGMLFSWSDVRVRSFWMKNTCLPLDMLFLERDGTVVGILEEVPVLNEDLRSIRCPAGYVLEVNAGWSRRHGIVPGMKASIEL